MQLTRGASVHHGRVAAHLAGLTGHRGAAISLPPRGVPGSSLELACVHGCLPSELAEAIRLLEEKRLSQLVEEFRPIRLRRAA